MDIRYPAAIRALSLVNKLPAGQFRTIHTSRVFRNLNRIRAELNKNKEKSMSQMEYWQAVAESLRREKDYLEFENEKLRESLITLKTMQAMGEGVSRTQAEIYAESLYPQLLYNFREEFNQLRMEMPDKSGSVIDYSRQKKIREDYAKQTDPGNRTTTN